MLRSLVMALHRLIDFAEKSQIVVASSFSDLLIGLISSRPSIFAEAMDTFTDFRSLAIRVLHREFFRCAEEGRDVSVLDQSIAVCIKVLWPSTEETEVTLPISLLKSLCVLLSIWRDPNGKDNFADVGSAVESLADALLRASGVVGNDCHEEAEIGLAGAKMLGSGSDAVSVESVSRCNLVGLFLSSLLPGFGANTTLNCMYVPTVDHACKSSQ